MKTFMFLVAAGLLAGCKAKQEPAPNLDAVVPGKIVLKDVTTGEKPSAALHAGYRAEWTYFGEKRVVQHVTNDAGLVTSISFGLGSDLDGQVLQRELEQKLSAEHGRKVAFDCRAQLLRLATVGDIPVTETRCTLRSATQLLTIRRVRFDRQSDVYGHEGLRMAFDRTEVKLEETGLERARVDADRSKSDRELDAHRERARRDI